MSNNNYTPPINILDNSELDKTTEKNLKEYNSNIKCQKIMIENLEKKIELMESELMNMSEVSDIYISNLKYDIEQPVNIINEIKESDEIKEPEKLLENDNLSTIYYKELGENIVNTIKNKISELINFEDLNFEDFELDNLLNNNNNNNIKIETNELYIENSNNNENMIYGNIYINDENQKKKIEETIIPTNLNNYMNKYHNEMISSNVYEYNIGEYKI